MSRLFEPLTLRDTVLPNRIAVSPMCQYSAADGLANDWHLVHLGSFAVGGAGLVMTEATSVQPEGRITAETWACGPTPRSSPCAASAAFIADQGAVAGIQLAHAGRKASTPSPGGPARHGAGGRRRLAARWAPRRSRSTPSTAAARRWTWRRSTGSWPAFADAARRALAAGFQVVGTARRPRLPAAPVPLPAQQPRARTPTAAPFEHRIRLLLEVAAAVRAVWPERSRCLCGCRPPTGWRAAGAPDETVDRGRAAQGAGGGPDRCLLGRLRAAGQGAAGARLPDRVRPAGAPGGRDPKRRGGPDHPAGPGRAHPAHRPGRPDPAGPGTAAATPAGRCTPPPPWATAGCPGRSRPTCARPRPVPRPATRSILSEGG